MATDGAALRCIEAKLPSYMRGGIIPASALGVVLACDGWHTGKIDRENGLLSLSGARRSITVKLIDGDYPDYRKVIPKDSGDVVRLKFNLKAAWDAIGILSAFSAVNGQAQQDIAFAVSGAQIYWEACQSDKSKLIISPDITMHPRGARVHGGFRIPALYKLFEDMPKGTEIFYKDEDFIVSGTRRKHDPLGPLVARSARELTLIMPSSASVDNAAQIDAFVSREEIEDVEARSATDPQAETFLNWSFARQRRPCACYCEDE